MIPAASKQIPLRLGPPGGLLLVVYLVVRGPVPDRFAHQAGTGPPLLLNSVS